MARKPIRAAGGGKVPKKAAQITSSPSRVIEDNFKFESLDEETLNKALANMAGRQYTKRTPTQIRADRSPRVYRSIRERD